MNTERRSVRCPCCAKAVLWAVESTYRPFCSERCKLVDFAQWASERYRLPVMEEFPSSEASDIV